LRYIDLQRIMDHAINSRILPCVLVVEDEDGPLEALRATLGPYYRVLTARNGEEGLQALRTEKVDVVTLDLKMPGISGMATLENIQAEHPDQEVVVITGHGNYERAIRAVRLRAFDWVNKPFDAKQVIDVVGKATAHRRARESRATELDRARQAIRDAMGLRSAFLANMSHEIRTPLNAIIGYAGIIAEHLEARGEQIDAPLVEGIERGCQRLLRTIQNVIDMAKLERGLFQLRPVEIALSPFIECRVAAMRAIADSKGLRLEYRSDEPAAHVRFDEYSLGLALDHLIENAIKFTRSGTVSIQLARDPERRLYVQVRDTGIGIDARYLDQLYEPFSQEMQGDTRPYQGLGLGLAVTKRFLGLNGASISAESRVGAGSTFTIRFGSELARLGPHRARVAPDRMARTGSGNFLR
jgi:signal transduction histidine kinase